MSSEDNFKAIKNLGESKLPRWLDLDFVHYEFNAVKDVMEFLVGLLGENKKWKVIFDDPIGIRVYDETDLCLYTERHSIPNECGVYQIKRSEHLNWFIHNSVKQEPGEIKNFAIITEDVVIEVLNENLPRILEYEPILKEEIDLFP